MQLDERKKTALAAFKEQIQKIDFPGGKAKIVKERATVTFEDGSSVLVNLSFLRSGYEKNEFGIYTDLIISHGRIYHVMDETGLAGGATLPDDSIFVGTSHDLVKGRSKYSFREGQDVVQAMSELTGDVQKFYVPIMRAFTGNYDDALKFILDGGAGYVRNPFTACVILLGLTADFGMLPKVIARAGQQSEDFYDFHAASDYRREIVTPIQNWFRDHPAGPSRNG